MILRNKIVPIALVAVLLGGTVGAFIAHRSSEPATTAYNTTPSTNLFDKQNARQISDVDNSWTTSQVAAETEKVTDPASYRVGFLDGFLAGRNNNSSTRDTVVEKTVVPSSRIAYVPTRSRYSRYDNTRRVYYDYNTQPRTRSFWQKHRDKLTVAMGTGGGALLGALIGGGKGAAIGALAGAGGSALYTYGIRKRNRSY